MANYIKVYLNKRQQKALKDHCSNKGVTESGFVRSKLRDIFDDPDEELSTNDNAPDDEGTKTFIAFRIREKVATALDNLVRHEGYVDRSDFLSAIMTKAISEEAPIISDQEQTDFRDLKRHLSKLNIQLNNLSRSSSSLGSLTEIEDQVQALIDQIEEVVKHRVNRWSEFF